MKSGTIQEMEGLKLGLAEKQELNDWSLERARLQAAPYLVSTDLRHGSEAVPFQNSIAGQFFAAR